MSTLFLRNIVICITLVLLSLIVAKIELDFPGSHIRACKFGLVCALIIFFIIMKPVYVCENCGSQVSDKQSDSCTVCGNTSYQRIDLLKKTPCPYCEFLHNNNDVICPHCKKNLPVVVCPYCNTVCNEKDKYCRKCGESLSKDTYDTFFVD